MSKALYRSAVKPELIQQFTTKKCNSSRRSVEVWTTTCIVTNFGKNANCSVLVNPSNPQLSGVRNFPYFPRGGPVPTEKPMTMHKDWQPLGFVSQWGGMEVGTGMLYPVSVIDGLVHQLGGWRLQAECRIQEAMAQNGEACPVGEAVMTSSGYNRLKEEYDAIVHTTPPFFRHHDKPTRFLQSCYQNSFAVAFASRGHSRVAMPLLGAGARGFPEEIAIEVAAAATGRWLRDEGPEDKNSEQVLAFGILERHHADHLVEQLEDHTRGL